MSNANITITERERSAIIARTDDGLKRLEHFTRDSDAKMTPRKLLGELTRRAYLAMSTEERLAHIRENVLAENLAAAIQRKEAALADVERRRSENASEPEALPIEQAEEPSPGAPWVVSCACGCGDWVPAPGPRARVAFSAGHRPERKRRRAEEQTPRVWAYA